MFFSSVFKCTQDNTAVASKSRMSDNQSQVALRQNSLDLLETAHVTTCTYTQLHKKKHFHAFLEFSVMSVHRN